MFSFLTEAANTPFVVALTVMILIVLLEVVSVSIGAGISEILDLCLPEFDVDIDLPDASPSTISQILNWFRVGEVPILMLFIVALTVFGLTGLTLQFSAHAITGSLLPSLTAIIPACFITLPFVRVISGLLNTYMPKDETWAVSENTLIGNAAVIIAGTAKAGKPVQAKVRDEHQQTHYVMVEPDNAEESFTAGDSVVLISRAGAVFKAVEDQGSTR